MEIRKVDDIAACLADCTGLADAGVTHDEGVEVGVEWASGANPTFLFQSSSDSGDRTPTTERFRRV